MTGKRNVVLVTFDSLRADHCGFMGYPKNTTPTLDGLADDGLVFETAIAPGTKTPETMPVLFTGEYPLGVSSSNRMPAIRDRIRHHMGAKLTVAEWFSRQGYETAAFTPNPWTSRHFGFDAGFDHFRDFMEQDRSSGIWNRMLSGEGSRFRSGLRLLASWIQRENAFKPWEDFYGRVLEWRESATDPYFLWIFVLDTHFPYLPGGGYGSQSRWRTYEANLRLYVQSQQTPYPPRVHDQLVTAYDDAIRYSDALLGRLTEDFRADDPLFVFTADHGEAFGEHGTYGHHQQLHDPNVHVPLVVSGGPTGTVQAPWSLDLLPGLLGQLATGSVDPPRRPVATAHTDDGDAIAVRGEEWKYVRQPDSERLSARGPPGTPDGRRGEVLELGRWMADRRSAALSEQTAIRRGVRELLEDGGLP